MHLFGFIIRIYHDERSPERQIYHDARSPKRQIYHDARSSERQIYHDARSSERQIYHDARSPERQICVMEKTVTFSSGSVTFNPPISTAYKLLSLS